MPGISAGDLEKFCYCPLSWKLSGTESADEATIEGSKRHHRMAGELESIVRGERRASVRARFAVDENAALGDSPVLQNQLNASSEELGRQRHT